MWRIKVLKRCGFSNTPYWVIEESPSLTSWYTSYIQIIISNTYMPYVYAICRIMLASRPGKIPIWKNYSPYWRTSATLIPSAGPPPGVDVHICKFSSECRWLHTFSSLIHLVVYCSLVAGAAWESSPAYRSHVVAGLHLFPLRRSSTHWSNVVVETSDVGPVWEALPHSAYRAEIENLSSCGLGRGCFCWQYMFGRQLPNHPSRV